MWDRLASKVASLESTTSLFLILLLQIAVFSPSLWFAVNGDDLVTLSLVAKVDSPWSYFVQDWGWGKGNYRPLSALSAWVSYRVFGVWGFPNHLLNLVVMCANAWLLLRIANRAQSDRTIAMLAVSVGMISLAGYRVGSGSLAAVGLVPFTCLLMLLDHFSQNEKTASPALVAVASSIAALMIESGLVVPLYALWASRHYQRRARFRVGAAAVGVMAAYVVIRLVALGADVASPKYGGYLWGVFGYYENWSELPPLLKASAAATNVIKNSLVIFLPIFHDEGGLLSAGQFLIRSPIWLPTALISGLSFSPRLAPMQKNALVIIGLNSLVHFGIFRYRINYISQMAFSLFVAASPHWPDLRGSPLLTSPSRRVTAFRLLAAVLLLFNIFWVGRSLSNDLVGHREALLDIGALPDTNPKIDRNVVQQVIALYGTPVYPPLR